MIAFPVKELERFHASGAQGPDVTFSVPFIELEVKVAFKEHAVDPDPDTICALRELPETLPERVPVDIHSEPVMDTVPLTVVLV